MLVVFERILKFGNTYWDTVNCRDVIARLLSMNGRGLTTVEGASYAGKCQYSDAKDDYNKKDGAKWAAAQFITK